MNTPHLLRTRVDRAALMQFAAETDVLDDDLGYALHLALRRRFGETAPQPFRLLEPDAAKPLLLGYGNVPLTPPPIGLPDPMGEWSRLPAIFPEAFEAKQMPPNWSSGLALRFDLRARPVRRYGSRARAVHGHGAGERDAYQAARSKSEGQPLDREQVYADWLSDRLSPVARLEKVSMTSFRRSRVFRALPGKAGRGRDGRGIEGPEAFLSGMLTVLDGPGFTNLLMRGVGRHTAFGYGMLLLKP